MALTKPQLKLLRQQLIVLRVKLTDEIKHIAHGVAKNPRDASGDLSSYPLHQADMASDASERELAVDLVSAEQKVLYQIDDALARFEEGVFGICSECEKAITISRLKAVPYASLCIKCQREEEQQNKR